MNENQNWKPGKNYNNKYQFNTKVRETFLQSLHNHLYKYLYLTFFLVSLFMIYVVYQIFIPTKYLPTDKVITISKNDSGEDVFINLKQNGIIKSVFWAKVTNKVLQKLGRDKFYRGDYKFEEGDSLYRIIYKITTRPPSLAVLIPEGFTKQQVADRLEKYITKFDKKDFLEKAEEGYLFPDTYYFFAYSTNDEILEIFSEHYKKNVQAKFGRLPTKEEVIIASMLEREARDPEDMKMISGIIQNRLKIDMALQIDATVLYGKGAWKNRVLYRDLKHDSDYNTYQNKGLPIGPISNPGLNALHAAIFPTKSKYYYYITGRDGKMYYAVTGEEHNANVRKYLR